MLVLVFADNFLLLFFWLGRGGFVSYILISFWFQRDAATFEWYESVLSESHW